MKTIINQEVQQVAVCRMELYVTETMFHCHCRGIFEPI